ncbi:MAG TPA: winged helix-turn-helix transcriptional regulator [Nitrososphaeraceae archaeon]|nr:winged helix-turn-helix transcriptional regulator [Nitrososphaeraceae archaeon]
MFLYSINNLRLLYRRYTIDEIKHKVIETLKKNDAGMSSVELADAIHVNRMTITKYLNILAVIGLIKRKKIGSVNIWTLEPGVMELELPLNYLQIQQNFITALLGNNKNETGKILLSTIYSDRDIIRIIKEIFIPSFNTLNEIYNRGRLGETELISLNNQLFDLMILLSQHHHRETANYDVYNIFIAGNEDQTHNSKIASIASEIIGFHTIYVGNIEMHIDPFFDIDIQRYITKLWDRKKGLKNIFIFSSEETSLRFLFTTAKFLKNKLTEEIKIILFVKREILSIAKDLNPDYVTSDINSLIAWQENLKKYF